MENTPDPVNTTLRSALAAAEERVVALSAQVRDLEFRLRASQQRLDGFAKNIPGILWESYFQQSPATHLVDYVSELITPLSGYSADEWKQPNFWMELIHPDDREQARAESALVFQNGSGKVAYRWITKDGRTLWVESHMALIRDESGAPVGLRGVTMDVTGIKQAEVARAEVRMREEMLRMQEEILLDLSTPLVPIDDQLLAMPLIGALDAKRADRALQVLLDGVSRNQARAVILDVTGVPNVDEVTANALVKTARAVSLLGAELVLTGIRPEVASTLVGLDVHLGTLVTCATLKAGIAHAMNGRKR